MQVKRISYSKDIAQDLKLQTHDIILIHFMHAFPEESYASLHRRIPLRYCENTTRQRCKKLLEKHGDLCFNALNGSDSIPFTWEREFKFSADMALVMADMFDKQNNSKVMHLGDFVWVKHGALLKMYPSLRTTQKVAIAMRQLFSGDYIWRTRSRSGTIGKMLYAPNPAKLFSNPKKPQRGVQYKRDEPIVIETYETVHGIEKHAEVSSIDKPLAAHIHPSHTTPYPGLTLKLAEKLAEEEERLSRASAADRKAASRKRHALEFGKSTQRLLEKLGVEFNAQQPKQAAQGDNRSEGGDKHVRPTKGFYDANAATLQEALPGSSMPSREEHKALRKEAAKTGIAGLRDFYEAQDNTITFTYKGDSECHATIPALPSIPDDQVERMSLSALPPKSRNLLWALLSEEMPISTDFSDKKLAPPRDLPVPSPEECTDEQLAAIFSAACASVDTPRIHALARKYRRGTSDAFIIKNMMSYSQTCRWYGVIPPFYTVEDFERRAVAVETDPETAMMRGDYMAPALADEIIEFVKDVRVSLRQKVPPAEAVSKAVRFRVYDMQVMLIKYFNLEMEPDESAREVLGPLMLHMDYDIINYGNPAADELICLDAWLKKYEFSCPEPVDPEKDLVRP